MAAPGLVLLLLLSRTMGTFGFVFTHCCTPLRGGVHRTNAACEHQAVGREAHAMCYGNSSSTRAAGVTGAMPSSHDVYEDWISKLACLMEEGIYLGAEGRTGEVIAGGMKGVWKARTMRTKPFDERWSRESSNMVGGVPWRVSDNARRRTERSPRRS